MAKILEILPDAVFDDDGPGGEIRISSGVTEKSGILVPLSDIGL